MLIIWSDRKVKIFLHYRILFARICFSQCDERNSRRGVLKWNIKACKLSLTRGSEREHFYVIWNSLFDEVLALLGVGISFTVRIASQSTLRIFIQKRRFNFLLPSTLSKWNKIKWKDSFSSKRPRLSMNWSVRELHARKLCYRTEERECRIIIVSKWSVIKFSI